jgi:putative ABC transport system substrate-binding protein
LKNGRMDIMKKRGLKKFAAGVTLLLALGLLAGCGGEKKEAGSKAQLNVGTTGRTQCA